MSDNENNNNDLMPEGGSSPPTDQVSQTDAPAVGSENNDTSSAEEKEEKPQGPSADNDNDESQGQETEGGEEPNKENKNDFSETAKNVGKSLTQKHNELLEAKKNDNKKDSLGDQMKDLNEVQVDKAFVSDSINLLGKISFDELIGNPLRAAVKAQRDLAKETLSYIREEGIKVDENGQGQITYVTMNFFRDGKQVKMRVPLLTLMPVPRLSISTMSYTFKAKVNAMSGVVASVGSGGTPINAGISTDNSSKSAASAKATTNSSSKGNTKKRVTSLLLQQTIPLFHQTKLLQVRLAQSLRYLRHRQCQSVTRRRKTLAQLATRATAWRRRWTSASQPAKARCHAASTDCLECSTTRQK